LAILSLIVQESRHGYQVEQVIEQRGMRDWAEIGFSSIYYLLAKLERKRLIKGSKEDRASRGPARRVYRVTLAGLAAWREAVLKSLAVAHRWYTPFMVGLANLPGIPADDALAALMLHRDDLRGRSKYVRRNLRLAKKKGGLPWHVGLLFDLSVTMTEAELAWVERLVARMQSLAKERKVSHGNRDGEPRRVRD